MDNDSFFSIDKLVEFGIGMSLARQMVNTMNTCMAQSNVPTVNLQSPAMPQLKPQFYAVINEQVAGPFEDQELSQLIEKNMLQYDTLVWKTGMKGWQAAKTFPEIYKMFLLKE